MTPTTNVTDNATSAKTMNLFSVILINADNAPKTPAVMMVMRQNHSNVQGKNGQTIGATMRISKAVRKSVVLQRLDRLLPLLANRINKPPAAKRTIVGIADKMEPLVISVMEKAISNNNSITIIPKLNPVIV